MPPLSVVCHCCYWAIDIGVAGCSFDNAAADGVAASWEVDAMSKNSYHHQKPMKRMCRTRMAADPENSCYSFLPNVQVHSSPACSEK